MNVMKNWLIDVCGMCKRRKKRRHVSLLFCLFSGRCRRLLLAFLFLWLFAEPTFDILLVHFSKHPNDGDFNIHDGLEGSSQIRQTIGKEKTFEYGLFLFGEFGKNTICLFDIVIGGQFEREEQDVPHKGGGKRNKRPVHHDIIADKNADNERN